MAPGARLGIFAGSWILAFTLLLTAGERKWTEVKSPNFIIISDASAKTAKRVAKRLEQFRIVFSSAFPKLRTDLPSPLIVFAARNEKSLKALIPSDYGKDGIVTPAGIFMPGPERKFVVLRADIPGDQRFHLIYHEYTHMLMDLNFQSLPLWLSEGMAEFFAFTNVSDGESRLGQAGAEPLRILKGYSLMPLETLMRVTHDSPYYRDRNKADIFYAQSWALTHYLMMGEGQKHLPELNEFLHLIENGVSDEEAEKRAFGSLNDLQRNLERYIRLFSFYYGSVRTELRVKEDEYSVRELSQEESLALRGEVLICADRLDEAKTMLEEALMRNPRSALANQAMGFFFFRIGEQEKAQGYFSTAADLDSRSYLALYFAAQMSYEQAHDYEASEAYLRKAIAINPRFAAAYSMLSQILMMQRKEDALTEALSLGVKAAELEPAELRHSINVGRILMEMEKYEEARSLAERILAVAREEPERGQAETLILAVQRREDRILEAKRREQAWREGSGGMEERQRTRGIREDSRESELADQTWDGESPPSKIKTGADLKVSGLIGSVKCDFPARMEIVLDSGGKQIRLLADNYYEVQYWAVGAPGKTGFQPCEELEGMYVEIGFMSVLDQDFAGLIKTVAIK
jgi:tetratricopeptide (TPR) repeat protein